MMFITLLLLLSIAGLVGLAAAAVYLWFVGESYTERYVAILDSAGRPTGIYVMLPKS